MTASLFCESESAGNGDALLLTAAELRGEMFFAVRHANAFQRMFSFLFPLGRAHVAIGEREFDVFIDREIADQIERLKDETDFAVADARAFGGRDLRDILAVHEISSTGGRIKQAEQRKQSGLAAT